MLNISVFHILLYSYYVPFYSRTFIISIIMLLLLLFFNGCLLFSIVIPSSKGHNRMRWYGWALIRKKKQKTHFCCSYESHVLFPMFSWNLLMFPYCFRMCSWFFYIFFWTNFSMFPIFPHFPFPLCFPHRFHCLVHFPAGFSRVSQPRQGPNGPPGHAATVDGWSDRRWRSMAGWSFSRCSPAELRIYSWYRMVNIPKKKHGNDH